jgi:hypothetical protein
MKMSIKSYKGFNKDMTCKGFQYEEGKEYETEKAECCETGFHACEYPLDCFSYYSPNESVFHEVEQDGELDREGSDTKVASTKIKIGASINIARIVKASIQYTTQRAKKENSSDKDCGASSATGYKGASSATGDYGASSATGNCGASSATGYKGASSAEDKDSVAVAWGYHGKAKGVIGSFLVLADWEGDEDNYWTQNLWTLKGAKMVQVDGKIIKENTWYTMVNGEIKEVESEE